MQRIVWVLFFILVWNVGVYGQVDPGSIAGIWLLDEGRGDVVADSSGNGHDGQINGAKWDDGKFGKALLFEGAEDVRIESTEKLNLSEEFTMMAYFSAQALNDWHQLIAKNNEYLLRIDPPGEGGKMSAFVNLGGWEPRASANVPKKDTWTHFAATYSGKDGELKVYVDGVSAGQSGRVGKRVPNNDPVTFGAWGGGSRFVGLIDEIAIFNTLVPEEDILAIATDGLEVYLGGGLSVQAGGKLTAIWGELKRRGS